MAQVRCPQGHTYDNSKVTNCPECPVKGLKSDLAGGSAGPRASAAGGGASRTPAAEGMGAADAPRQQSSNAPTGAHPTTKIRWKKPSAPPAGAPSVPSAAQSAGSQRDSPAMDQPVAGWLVAYEGPLAGTDFRVYCGNNSIGRGYSNHIHLGNGDMTIHAERHAFIMYDPVSNAYGVRAGDHQLFVYVREEASYGGEARWKAVWNAEDLKPYDEIMMGETKFVFVPLCGENFKWDL